MAVLELKSKLKGQEKEDIDAGYLADVVRSGALDAMPGLRVMTHENMLVLLAATGRKLDECEGECEVDTGRRLGADIVVSGELLKFGSNYKLNLRMHQTSDGRLLAGAQASGKTVDELDQATSAAVRKLLAGLAPPKPAPAPVTSAPSASAPSPGAPTPTPPAPGPAPTRAAEPSAAAPAGSLNPPAYTHPELFNAAHQTLAPDPQLVESALHPGTGDDTAKWALGSCSKDARSCFSLASAYQNGSFQLPQDKARAEAVYLYGCGAGDLNGCVMAMNFEWQGLAGQKDMERARQLARHACLSGSAMACHTLQWSLGAQEGERDIARAALEQQCVKKAADACFYIGAQHEDAAWKQYGRDATNALCREGNSSSCSYAGSFRQP